MYAFILRRCIWCLHASFGSLKGNIKAGEVIDWIYSLGHKVVHVQYDDVPHKALYSHIGLNKGFS